MSRVFISYSQEAPAHNERVAGLVCRLRKARFDVAFDRDQPAGGPSRGWAAWSEQEIQTADKVLVVCSEKYGKSYDGKQPAGRGRGSVWEAGVIRAALYESNGVNTRFRAAVFDAPALAFVPWCLRGVQVFRVEEPDGYSEMVAWLANAPEAAVRQKVAIPQPDDAEASLPADVAAEPIFDEVKTQILRLRRADEIKQTADDYANAGMGPEALYGYTALEEAAVRESNFRLYAYANEQIGAVYWRAGDRARARQRWKTTVTVYTTRFRNELPELMARIDSVSRTKPDVTASR